MVFIVFKNVIWKIKKTEWEHTYNHQSPRFIISKYNGKNVCSISCWFWQSFGVICFDDISITWLVCWNICARAVPEGLYMVRKQSGRFIPLGCWYWQWCHVWCNSSWINTISPFACSLLQCSLNKFPCVNF